MFHLLLMALILPARASDDCEDLCANLDAADETCEAYFGDGDPFCETIGVVDDAYCPDDSDFDGDCDDFCEDVDFLDEGCDESLGEDHAICASLDAISETCEDSGWLDDEDDDDDSDADADDEEEDDDGEESEDTTATEDGGTSADPASGKATDGEPHAAACGTQSTPLASVIGFAAAAAVLGRRRRA